MKVTKTLKTRHAGLLEEIAKEVKVNEKFIDGAVSKYEAARIKEEMRKLANEQAGQVRTRCALELK